MWAKEFPQPVTRDVTPIIPRGNNPRLTPSSTIPFYHELREPGRQAPQRQGGYGIQVSDRNMHGAITTVAQENAYHPVREMLTRMKWDGIARVDHLFVDYLGCTDDAYHRQMARLMLLGAVTRIGLQAIDVFTLREGQHGRKSTRSSHSSTRYFGLDPVI